MRSAMARNLPGTRLQGVRHGAPRTRVPVRIRTDVPSQCVRFGNPAFPVSDIYAGRRDGKSGIV